MQIASAWERFLTSLVPGTGLRGSPCVLLTFLWLPLFGFGDKSSRVAWFLSMLWDQDILPPQPPGTHLTLALPSFLPSPQKQLQGFLPEELRQNNWLEGEPRAPSSKCIDKANSLQWPSFYLHEDFAGNVGHVIYYFLSYTFIITLIF